MNDDQCLLKYVKAYKGRSDFKPDLVKGIIQKLEKYIASDPDQKNPKTLTRIEKLEEHKAVLRAMEASA